MCSDAGTGQNLASADLELAHQLLGFGDLPIEVSDEQTLDVEEPFVALWLLFR